MGAAPAATAPVALTCDGVSKLPSEAELGVALPPVQPVDTTPPPVTANRRAFRVLVRNAMFRRVELAAIRRYDLLTELDPDIDWAAAMTAYHDEYGVVGTDADARGPHLLVVEELPDRWLVRQIFDDPNDDHDWGISGEVDLAASDERGEAVVRVTAVGPH